MLAKATSSEAFYSDIFAEQRVATSIVLDDGKIEKISSGRDSGVGIRTLFENTCHYAYSNDFSGSALLELASSVSPGGRIERSRSMNLMKKNPSLSLPIEKPPSEISLKTKIRLLQQAENAARKFSRDIKQVTISYSDLIQELYIANSNNNSVSESRSYTLFSINVVATDGDLIQTGRETSGGMIGFELFEELDIEELSLRASERAIRMLYSKNAPSGRMPVVISAEAGGTMIHEAIGHGLEADLVQQGLSVYKDKMSRVMASPLVTIVDDSTIPGKRGSFLFDDEGTHSQRTLLVDKGILKGFMYDMLTSHRDDRSSTGNGRRQSYRYRPIPRMSNTIMLPGNSAPEDVFRGIRNGLFVRKMGGGQVNTVSGDFVFDVQDACLIENGAIGDPVRGATLTGNGPQVLMNIDVIANDLGFSLGTCGKDSQGVPVSDALPTLRVREMVVGGKN